MRTHPADPRHRQRPHPDSWCVVMTTDRPSDTFDLTVFEQAQTWTDRDGQTFLLVELDDESRANLARWLRAHARHFYLQVLLREPVVGPRPSVVAVSELVFMSADQWMARTPLLRQLEGEDAAGS